MNARDAAWVRAHVWTLVVRTEAAHPGTILNNTCSCLQPFTCSHCAAGRTAACPKAVFFTAETVVIGVSGWAVTEGGAVWVWLADRTCVQQCHGAPAPDRTPPVQLNLFAVAA